MHAQHATPASNTPLVGGSIRGERTTRRILNLLFSLNVASAPLTTSQIIDDPGIGYPGDKRDSREKTFQRDRKTLLDLGIHVREVAAPGGAVNEERRWEIDRAHTHAQANALAPYDAEEALAAIDLIFVLNAEDPSRWPLQTARAKLCAVAGISSSGHAGTKKATRDGLEHIWSAFERRRPVTFTYCNAQGVQRSRTVCIHGFFEQGNLVYLVGKDEEAHGLRTFRTDRISRVKAAPQSRKPYTIPVEFDIAGYQFLPFDFGEGAPTPATFCFPSGIEAPEITLITKERGTLTQCEDGGWTWNVDVRNLNEAARFTLEHAGSGMHALKPAELRHSIRALVEQAVSIHDR